MLHPVYSSLDEFEVTEYYGRVRSTRIKSKKDGGDTHRNGTAVVPQNVAPQSNLASVEWYKNWSIAMQRCGSSQVATNTRPSLLTPRPVGGTCCPAGKQKCVLGNTLVTGENHDLKRIEGVVFNTLPTCKWQLDLLQTAGGQCSGAPRLARHSAVASRSRNASILLPNPAEVSESASSLPPSREERAVGCLVGAMCGNVLGAPVHHDRHWMAVRRFPDGLVDFWKYDIGEHPVGHGQYTGVECQSESKKAGNKSEHGTCMVE